MRLALLPLLVGCSAAEYECAYDDPALGVYEEGEMACADYRSFGDQVLEGIRETCEEDAAAAGADPATCTCSWVRRCSGDAND